MPIVTCSVSDCQRVHYANTLCNLHYNRVRNTGTTELRSKPKKYCKVDGCGVELGVPQGRGMCGLHYGRWRKSGSTDTPAPKPVRVGVAECEIHGCNEVIQARNWCSKHWTRWDRYGSPTARVRGEIVDGCRICTACKADKPLSSFSRGRGGQCKDCVAKVRREARAIEPDYISVTTTPMKCAGCGVEFLGNKVKRRYCTKSCADKFLTRDNWKHGNARRARMRSAFVERFDRYEIFDRDGWVCQICNEPIGRDEVWPSQRMPSLDHIKPIARGGKHSRANAQAAHLSCNVRKGVKIIS